MSNLPGWRPGHSSPPPPPDTNGWGRYVAVTLEHILVRLHYIEEKQRDDQHLSHRASDAPTTKPPKDSTWSDRRDLAKDIASIAKDFRTGLMWIAVIVLLVGLIAKRIDLTQLQTLKFWLATPG